MVDRLKYDRCLHCHGQIYYASFFGWRHVRRDNAWCPNNKGTKAEPGG